MKTHLLLAAVVTAVATASLAEDRPAATTTAARAAPGAQPSEMRSIIQTLDQIESDPLLRAQAEAESKVPLEVFGTCPKAAVTS